MVELVVTVLLINIRIIILIYVVFGTGTGSCSGSSVLLVQVLLVDCIRFGTRTFSKFVIGTFYKFILVTLCNLKFWLYLFYIQLLERFKWHLLTVPVLVYRTF